MSRANVLGLMPEVLQTTSPRGRLNLNNELRVSINKQHYAAGAVGSKGAERDWDRVDWY